MKVERIVNQAPPEVNTTVKEVDIFNKYRNYILSAREGYLRGWKMSEIEEIHSFVNTRLGKPYAVNYNCSMCIIDLINVFAKLKG
jgi:hypothetical protein